MPRISKQALEPHQLTKLYSELTKTVIRLTRRKADTFFDELLGKEEKIMITKRFAAIVMLLEHNSAYRTAQLLHLSKSTTCRLRDKIAAGEFSTIEELVKRNKKEYVDFWNTLEVILRAGMPPRGKGRWKSTLELMNRK